MPLSAAFSLLYEIIRIFFVLLVLVCLPTFCAHTILVLHYLSFIFLSNWIQLKVNGSVMEGL